MSRRVQAGTNRWRNEKRQELEIQLRELADADTDCQIEFRLVHIIPYLPGFDLPQGHSFSRYSQKTP
jgi:hypothetical protein